MEGVLQVSLPPSKKKKWDNLNFDMCILCQKRKKEDLVQTSRSTQKLLDALTTRRMCEDEEYGQVAECLKDFTVAELEECKGSWHLSCYKLCTRKDMIEKVQKQDTQSKQVSIDSVCSSTPQPDLPYTRSRGIHLEKSTYFFVINMTLNTIHCLQLPQEILEKSYSRPCNSLIMQHGK